MFLVLPSTTAFARAIASSQPLPRSISGRAGGDLAGQDLRGPGERLLEEVGRTEYCVDDAELEGLLRVERLVLVQRVLEDDGDGVRGADEVGQQLRSAPARHQSEERLGQTQAPALSDTVR